MSETHHILGEDQPKQNPWRQDQLGYSPVAQQLAKTIIRSDVPNGYVIGLHGEWGSGKSTMLNFVLAHIEKHNAENEHQRIHHIDFRPWLISGQQDLISGFFKLLTEKLAHTELGKKQHHRRIAKFFRAASDDVVDAAAKLALTIDPTGGVAASSTGALAKRGIGAVLSRYLEEPSLQRAYETLRVQLAKSEMRFLVTIDDIDRLEEEEVKSIMQMVKSIGQLPNVTYLLSYDRRIVDAVLGAGTDRKGPKYMEKIVQQDIELPRLRRSDLLKLLDIETSFLIANTPQDERWNRIVLNGVYRWIRTPRDVVRLSNALKFTWPALENEIDAQDLLVMEGLRLFDAAVFNWIRDNRDFLFSEGQYIYTLESDSVEVVESLKRRITAEDQKEILALLSDIFPLSQKHFESKGSFYARNYEDVQRRRGVGSAEGYDTYFAMKILSETIPKTLIERIVATDADIDFIRHTLTDLLATHSPNGIAKIVPMLDELRIRYRGSARVMPSQSLFAVLFELGEQIIETDGPNQAFTIPPRAVLRFLIENMLEIWGIEQSNRIVLKAFQETESVAFLAEMFTDFGKQNGTMGKEEDSKILISLDVFTQIGMILKSKIEAAYSEGTLDSAPYYFNIIRAWLYLGGGDNVLHWMTTGMKSSATFLAKIGRGLVGHSIGTAVRSYSMHERPDPNLYNLSFLHEVSGTHLSDSELTDVDRQSSL